MGGGLFCVLSTNSDHLQPLTISEGATCMWNSVESARRWLSSGRWCSASLPTLELGEHANLQLATGIGMTQIFRASPRCVIQGLGNLSVSESEAGAGMCFFSISSPSWTENSTWSCRTDQGDVNGIYISPCHGNSCTPTTNSLVFLSSFHFPQHNISTSKMHAPEINNHIKGEAVKLDKVSDEIDEVNVLKLKQKDAVEKTQAEIDYDLASKFDQEKDKAAFRQYEEACDRVKNFYAVSHLLPLFTICS